MKTVAVTVNDEEYVLGKLSCGQVDEIIFANFEMRQDAKDPREVVAVAGGKRAVRSQMCPAIAASLNNAIQGDAKWYLNGWTNPDSRGLTKWWIGDDVFTELDYHELNVLYAELAKLSGLRTATKNEAAKPAGGETADDSPASS
jgi:hypothetical protein